MTPDNPYDRQARRSRDYRLDWYYVTEAHKCCGLYPAIDHTEDGTVYWFYCENCGRKSIRYNGTPSAKHEAINLWNQTKPAELTLFDFMEE